MMTDPDSPPAGPLGKIYTLAEVAAQLRTSRAAAARVARRTGCCSIVGRSLLFNAADVVALWEAMRAVRPHPRERVVPFKSERDLQKSLEKFLGPKYRPHKS